MGIKHNTHYARHSQKQTESRAATGQGFNTRRNLSKETSRFFFALIAIALLFGACVQDIDEVMQGVAVPGDDMALVTLSLSTPATRAVATDAENAIAEIDVILFGADDKFNYRARGTSISNQNGAPYDMKKFEVRLPVGGPYKMVVLANARTAIAALPASISLPIATVVSANGASRKAVLDGIAQSLPADAKLGTTNFPMWGYRVENLAILESGNSSITPNIDLTRAVARIDVSVDGGKVSNFELKSVYLYNYNDKGSIAPAVSTTAGNLDGYDGSQWKVDNNEKKAFAPHVPSSANKLKGPLSYEAPFEQTIYAFEAAAGKPVTENGWKENTCLVIGGMYNDGVTAPYPTYYRVEFNNATSGNLALLRNHLYNVVIKEVKGHGWGTPDLAYDNLPSNLVAQITAWNDGELNDVTFNGQHYLAVDKSSLDFYKEGNAKRLRVITDYPAAWKIENLPSWLTYTVDPAAAANVQSTLVFTAAAGDATDLPRSYRFHVVAGNLRKEITVAQSADEEFSLEVDPWEMVFYKTPAAQTLVVTPYPATSGYELSFVSPSTFAWDNGFSFPAPAEPPLVAPLTFQPVANNTGKTINGALLVTLTGPSGQTIAREVNIRQLAREMEFLATTANPYPAEAGAYAFTVMSEGPWKLSTSESWLALEPAEGAGYHPATPSYAYRFTLAANLGGYARHATVTVEGDHAASSPWTTFEVIQSGVPPYLEITSPQPVDGRREIDFDASKSPETVALKTNARWTFTTDSDYSNVIAGAQVVEITGNPAKTGAAGAIYSENHTPDQPELLPTIIFTPQPDSHMPPTGKMSTVVTFSTAAPGAPVVSRTITIKRRDIRTYVFSNNYDTLTLFPTFDRGANFAGIKANVKELGTPSINNSVKALAIQGGISEDQLKQLRDRLTNTVDNLLPNLTSLSLPDFSGAIPQNAFEAVNLSSIDIPGATSIEQKAFKDCANLKTASFPLVTTVESYAFSGCTGLEEVDLPNVREFKLMVFYQCPEYLRLKIDSPEKVLFNKQYFSEFRRYTDTFFGVGSKQPGTAGTGTTKMTLYLGENAKDAKDKGRPTDPQNKAWGGYQVTESTWNPYTWGAIKPYE